MRNSGPYEDTASEAGGDQGEEGSTSGKVAVAIGNALDPAQN